MILQQNGKDYFVMDLNLKYTDYSLFPVKYCVLSYSKWLLHLELFV